MDSSNISHFFAALFIPLAWGAILYPFARRFLTRWPVYFGSVLALSLVAIVGKEWLDKQPALNDIVSDLLGFFFGAALVSARAWRRARVLGGSRPRDLNGVSVSLRATLRLMERVERRTAVIYLRASLTLPDPKAAQLALRLSRDARQRAARIHYALSLWKGPKESHELRKQIEKSLDASELFQLDHRQPRDIPGYLAWALAHERAKYDLFSRFKSAFREEWKIMQLQNFLLLLRYSILRLESKAEAAKKAGKLGKAA